MSTDLISGKRQWMDLTQIDEITLQTASKIKELANGLTIIQFNTAVSIAKEYVSENGLITILRPHNSTEQDL